jgi:CheY-like chemotaxis protein
MRPQVLVADAERRSLRVLEAALGSAGYRVTPAVDANDALALAVTAPPDVVVADAQLPGVGDGYDLVAHLRQHPATAATPVLLVTRPDAPVDRDRAHALGVAEVLAKPVFVRELLAWIDLLVVRRAKSYAARALSMPAHAFSGWTRDLPVVDLLQLFDGLHATGVVRLAQGDQRGEIHFRQGRAIDALSGRLSGEAAVYALVTWKDAAFELSVEPVVGEDVVDRSTGTLRMEGMRWVEEWERLQERLRPRGALAEADPIRLLPLAASRGGQADSQGAIEPVASVASVASVMPAARVDSTPPFRRVEPASPSVPPMASVPSVAPTASVLTPSVPPESHAVDLTAHVEPAPARREESPELAPRIEPALTHRETPAVDVPEQAAPITLRPEALAAVPPPRVEPAAMRREAPAVDLSPRTNPPAPRPTAPSIDLSPRVDTAHARRKQDPQPAVAEPPVGEEPEALEEPLALAREARTLAQEPESPSGVAGASGSSGSSGTNISPSTPPWTRELEPEFEAAAAAEEDEPQVAGVPRRINPRSKRIVAVSVAAAAFICIAGGARALSLSHQRAAETAAWHAGSGVAAGHAASVESVPPPSAPSAPSMGIPAGSVEPAAAIAVPPAPSDDPNANAALAAAEPPNGADALKPLAAPPGAAAPSPGSPGPANPGSIVPAGESVLPFSGPPRTRGRSALVADAEQALLKGAVDRAVELATKATTETPEDADAWLALGAAHRAAHEMAAARQDYRNCVAHAVTPGITDCRVLGK